jgi:hypothetical protein
VTASTLDTTPRATSARGAVSNAETTVITFFLGTHQPGWLTKTHPDGPGSAAVPLFISDRRLRGYQRLPRALAPWALDSGGFTELATHGTWDHGPTPARYAARIRRYRDEIGHLAWAAPQDWMCEPWILTKTSLSVADHQRRTVDNYLQLRDLAPDLPIIPVVQGWTTADYLRCADRYERAGVDLTTAPLVGVGSVCRRQDATEAGQIITALHAHGVTRLHGFGFKVLGLRRYARLLVSADSMAWSIAARRRAPLPECTGHRNCANCPRYAYRWRHTVLTACAAARPVAVQPALFHLPSGEAA